MSYPINYPTPQGANIQMFYAPNRTGSNEGVEWVKPQGASFVWFTLIGPGASGTGTTGGGSGAVTNCMVPAFLIPDILNIRVGQSDFNRSEILYRLKATTPYVLLFAENGVSSTGGAAMTSNYFTASGFFQSVAGQNGSTASVSASASTFLSGGGASASTQASNYGYSLGTSANVSGFFQTQPIIVGAGGMGLGVGGIGCGAGSANNNTGSGGNGLVVIITW